MLLSVTVMRDGCLIRAQTTRSHVNVQDSIGIQKVGMHACGLTPRRRSKLRLKTRLFREKRLKTCQICPKSNRTVYSNMLMTELRRKCC